MTATAVRRVAALCLLTIVATACEHKPLCWHHPHTTMLKVDFAWWDAPEGREKVTSMALYVYPKDGSPNQRIVFPGSAGGIIELVNGDYDFVCLNADTETLIYNGTHSHGTFTVSTPTSHVLAGMTGRVITGNFNPEDDNMKRAEGTYDERVGSEAEDAYGHGITDYTVQGEPGVLQVVTLYPNNITYHYHIIIENVGCPELIQLMSGTLSGLTGEVRVHDCQRIGGHTIVPFPLYLTEDNTIEGHFVAFGHCPEEVIKAHKLALYIESDQGDHRFFEWDVTEQVHEQDGELYVTIIVGEVDLCGMNGLDLVVDPWVSTPPIILPMQ